MVIEKLKIEDLEEVLALQKTLVPFEFTLEDAVKAYTKLLSNSDYLIAVAKEDNEVIGTLTGVCCYTLTAPFLVIEDVVVKEGIRGKGIGSQLMEAVEQFGKEKNCAYAIIVSSGYRTRAHKFYEKQGFTEDVQGFRKYY